MHESFGVLDNAVHEFLAARDIVNQTCDHTCGPAASIECAIVQGASPTLSGDQMLDVINCGITARLDVSDFIGDLVPEHASRVPECPEDKCRITFGGFDETLLDVVVHRGFLRSQEPCPHVHAIGSESERGYEAASVAKAT